MVASHQLWRVCVVFKTFWKTFVLLGLNVAGESANYGDPDFNLSDFIFISVAVRCLHSSSYCGIYPGTGKEKTELKLSCLADCNAYCIYILDTRTSYNVSQHSCVVPSLSLKSALVYHNTTDFMVST